MPATHFLDQGRGREVVQADGAAFFFQRMALFFRYFVSFNVVYFCHRKPLVPLSSQQLLELLVELDVVF
jgi:ribosomal protein L24E